MKSIVGASVAVLMLVGTGCAAVPAQRDGGGEPVGLASQPSSPAAAVDRPGRKCREVPLTPVRLTDDLKVWQMRALAVCVDGRMVLQETRPAGSMAQPVVIADTYEIARLMAMLSRPDARRGSLPCPVERDTVPRFALITNEGEYLQPQIPRDPCGRPDPAILGHLRRTIAKGATAFID